MKSSKVGYGRMAQAFHWISTVIILLMWPMGLYMNRVAVGDTQVMLYQIHVGLGLLLLVMTVARVIWRFFEPTPAMPAKLSLVQKRTIKIVRIFTYFVMLLLTFSGVGILLVNGMSLLPGNIVPDVIKDGPAMGMHVIAYRLMLLLLIMHIAGIARYQMRYGDVMGRMGINLSNG